VLEEEPMSDDKFKEAQDRVQTLTTRPSNETLLDLYALFKQGTVGDVQGKRPGMLDVKGRAKYDAWAKRKGMSTEDAQAKYIELVDSLVG
jgi:acyl-CoA-binding protein